MRLLTPRELDSLPEPAWLIAGILPSKGLSVLYGDPACGKTFVALSMSLSIAAGHNWCKKMTCSGTVLYLAAEGLFGLKQRVAAYQTLSKVYAEQILYSSADGLSLLDPKSVDRLSEQLALRDFAPDLIVFDTLARLMPGGDENSAKEMGTAICAIDQLRSKFKASALIIHHSGKSGPRERGSSALRGAADAMLMLKGSPQSGVVTLECEKMKDAEPFQKFSLGLEKVRFGSLSSMAVANWAETISRATETANEDRAIAILREFGQAGATSKAWSEAWVAAGLSKSTFYRTLKGAREANRVRHHEQRYFAKD